MKNILGLAVLICSCAPQGARLDVVPQVDLNRYLGQWFEIAALPAWFEKGCSCVQAEYSLHPKGYVVVRNSCLKDGKPKVAEGKAFVVPNTGNAKLKVQFFWPFKGDYWILELAPDYSYVLVGEPKREYLWILSRAPQMEESTYRMLVGKAAQKGFDPAKIRKMKQDCAK